MLRIEKKLNLKPLSFKRKIIEMSHALEDSDSEVLVRDFKDPFLELIRLLRESSEIEHALMVQYLYASYSIKPKYQSLSGFAYPNATTILGVAIQEMQHLHSVNKFLVKLGVVPNLERQDFPFEPDIYPFHFDLERLSQYSLAKYVYTEASSEDLVVSSGSDDDQRNFVNKLHDVLGNEFKINHLGSVYMAIINIAQELENSGRLAFSISENIKEMEAIKDEGEDDHFDFFKEVFLGTHSSISIVNDIWTLPQSNDNYPSYNVPSNPSALLGHKNQIKDEELRLIGWLSNIHYWIVLKLLNQSYLDAFNFSELFSMSKDHMIGPLNILGTELAKRGAGAPFDPLSMGYNLGAELENNLEIIMGLLLEGKEIAQQINSLPLSFNYGIYDQNIQKLQSINQNV